MIGRPDDSPNYLHHDPVDFRNAINGLVVLVSEQMSLYVNHKIFAFSNTGKRWLYSFELTSFQLGSQNSRHWCLTDSVSAG